MREKLRKLIQARDAYCWHCGDTETLVTHHRRNRGMGGSKDDSANVASNLILVCWAWNDAMERHPQSARDARMWGQKLWSWQETRTPVYDRVEGRWWVLTDTGEKREFIVDEGRAFRLQLPELFAD